MHIFRSSSLDWPSPVTYAPFPRHGRGHRDASVARWRRDCGCPFDREHLSRHEPRNASRLGSCCFQRELDRRCHRCRPGRPNLRHVRRRMHLARRDPAGQRGTGPGPNQRPCWYSPCRWQGAMEDLSATGDLDIVDDVDLVGAGSALTTISAAGLGQDRVLDVVSSHDGTVSIQGIGLTGGNTNVAGGGLFHRDGTLSIVGHLARWQHSDEGGGLAFFGAGGDVLTIDGLAAIDNVSTGFGGGISLGASTGSSSRITDAVISNNRAREGGGIAIGAQGSPLGPDAIAIAHTRIEGNVAAEHGGGVFGNSFTLRDVVVDDNETVCTGGGIRADNSFVLERVAVTRNKSLEAPFAWRCLWRWRHPGWVRCADRDERDDQQ